MLLYPTEDVQEEIEELLENVPDLNSTFVIEDKIGAGKLLFPGCLLQL